MTERKKELLKEILTRFKNEFKFAEVQEDIDKKAAGNIEDYTPVLLADFLKDYVHKTHIDSTIQELEERGFWSGS